MDKKTHQNERRRYYRIDDDVMMSYQVVTETGPAEFSAELADDTLTPFGLINYLRKTTDDAKSILSRIERKDKDMADYMRLMNEKIENLAKLFIVEKTNLKNKETKNINISAGGIGFNCDEEIKPGSWLEIKLVMYPSLLGIHTFGKVIRCERENCPSNHPEPYFVGVEFEKLREMDRDLLIGHILRKQSIMIRSAKEELERTKK